MAKELVPYFSQYLIAKQYNLCESSNSDFSNFFFVSEGKEVNLNLIPKIFLKLSNFINRNIIPKVPGDTIPYSFNPEGKKCLPKVSNVTETSFDFSFAVVNINNKSMPLLKTQHSAEYLYVTYNVSSDSMEMNLVDAGNIDRKAASMPTVISMEQDAGGCDRIKGILELLNKESVEKKGFYSNVYRDNERLPGADSTLAIDYGNGKYRNDKMKGEFVTTEMMFDYVKMMNESILNKVASMKDNSPKSKIEDINARIAEVNSRRKSGELTMAEWSKIMDGLNKELTNAKREVRNANKALGNVASVNTPSPEKTTLLFEPLYEKKQLGQAVYLGDEDKLLLKVLLKGPSIFLYYELSETGADLFDYTEDPECTTEERLRGIYDDSKVDIIKSIEAIDSVEGSMKKLYEEMIQRARDSYSGEYRDRTAKYKAQKYLDELNLKRGSAQFDSEAEEYSQDNIDKAAIRGAKRLNKKLGIPPQAPSKETEEEERKAANESFDIFSYISKHRS